MFRFLILLCCSFSVLAAIYKSVDSDGNVVLSDVPSQNSEEITLPPPQLYSIPKSEKTTPEVNASTKQAPFYQRVEFVNLKNQATVRNNNAVPLLIKINIVPELRAGDQVDLLIDGKSFGTPAEGPSRQAAFEVKGVNRGEHTIQARVSDIKSKKPIFYSNLFTIYFQQNSVANKDKLIPLPET